MNRIEFISKLDNSLKGISYEDKKEIIYDYEEHFTVGIEQGKTEDEIANDLGDPKFIAKQFRNDYFIKRAENNKSASNLMNAIFASVGVGFLNLLLLPLIIAAACILFSLLLAAGSLVLALLVTLGSLLFAFYAVAVSMTIGGIGIFLEILLEPLLPEFINIDINTGSAVFLAIGVLCLGILSFIGSKKLTPIFCKCSKKCIVASCNGGKKCSKGFYMWVLRYLKMNVSIITKKKENEDVQES